MTWRWLLKAFIIIIMNMVIENNSPFYSLRSRELHILSALAMRVTQAACVMLNGDAFSVVADFMYDATIIYYYVYVRSDAKVFYQIYACTMYTHILCMLFSHYKFVVKRQTSLIVLLLIEPPQ